MKMKHDGGPTLNNTESMPPFDRPKTGNRKTPFGLIRRTLLSASLIDYQLFVGMTQAIINIEKRAIIV